jgi:hypothetical protein
MALREEEPKFQAKYLVRKGIPLFLIAVVISVLLHSLAQTLIGSMIGKSNLNVAGSSEFLINQHPVAAAAGTIFTLVIAFVSFRYSLHFPHNLFAVSMAFVNASMRLTEIVTVFIQMLIYKKTTVIADESILLSLIPLNNPTPIIVLLCFLSCTRFTENSVQMGYRTAAFYSPVAFGKFYMDDLQVTGWITTTSLCSPP